MHDSVQTGFRNELALEHIVPRFLIFYLQEKYDSKYKLMTQAFVREL